ncbi:MAG: type II CAAX prenyl endopeptidase Rce1 family protein [Methyloceanibacter sp.]
MSTLGAGVERNIRLQARHGLAIYFAVLVPLSAVFETLTITHGLSWVSALMWTPAAASVVARLALRQGFADVSFGLGGRRGCQAIVLALIFPIIVGLISYGIAWTIGLVQFSPHPVALLASYIGNSTSPALVLAANIAVAASIGTIFSVRTAAGEEIGWRGYMLTRLIDAGVPKPILVSGVIWALWHVPLILGGVYLAGPPLAVSVSTFMLTATSVSFVLARLRLETGSIWPPIALHAAWNSIIQGAFDPASAGPGAPLWVGEGGILVMLTMVAAAVIFTRTTSARIF